MAIAMVAMLAFGGTYAYFTATTTAKTGTVAFGKVSLVSGGNFTFTAQNVVPGETIASSQSVTYTNNSTVDSYIAVVFSVKYTGNYWDGTKVATYTNQVLTSDQIEQAFGENALSVGANWVAGKVNSNVYMLSDTTDLVIAGVSGEGSPVDFIAAADLKISENLNRNFAEGAWKGTEAGELQWEEATIVVSIEAYSIQASNITGLTAPAGKADTDVDTVWAKIGTLVGAVA